MYYSYSIATYLGVTVLMFIFSFIQFNTVVMPLLEIKKEKKRKARKDYKSIDEFILSLENKSFLELLKVYINTNTTTTTTTTTNNNNNNNIIIIIIIIVVVVVVEKAMENFCIENVLLWEAYYDLMLNIKDYYLKSGKKYNTNNVLNSSFYESGAQLQMEDKSEIFECNDQSGKVGVDNENNITKESILENENDQYSSNILSNNELNINDDKTSMNEYYNIQNQTKEIHNQNQSQNNNPNNMSYSPSTSYPIRQVNNCLNSTDKLSTSNSLSPDNQLLSTSDNNNKHILLKNESQSNIIQTPINQVILNEISKSSIEINDNKHMKNYSNDLNIDISDVQKHSKMEIQIEPSNSNQNDNSNIFNREESNVSNNNVINPSITSPVSPSSHPPLSRKTSRASNDPNISRVTSIHSTKNVKNSQNNLNGEVPTFENKSHLIDIGKFEKASCLSKYSIKDKESDIHNTTKKKPNIGTANNSKSLLKYIKSLTLYNCEFDPKFKPLFDQIYYLYIYKDGIAPVILTLNTLTTISNRIENEDYSYDMYQSAIEEVINILYMNIYPKIE
ncbi:hypothetical protein PIROE2DRAFT_2854 [Piromyces sp. E2]|nr:hypothetical protein PIROE2DRAFT_2854 [Piromyces sp. E2]|eukprot:OUM69163.1 hypothetical protein PIROE2DRAFT_2854 [Piromyces sp. E2]